MLETRTNVVWAATVLSIAILTGLGVQRNIKDNSTNQKQIEKQDDVLRGLRERLDALDRSIHHSLEHKEESLSPIKPLDAAFGPDGTEFTRTK